MIAATARDAYRTIQDRLRPYVARRVAPAEVDDVVQEVLTRVHLGIANLRDGERFGGWVYQIAKNAIADLGRNRVRDPLGQVAAGDALHRIEQESDDSERLVHELGECVAPFVLRLPSPYREAITLTELQGMKQADAAEACGVSLSGMKSRVQRGRDKLREMFDACCEISVDCRGRVVSCERRGSEC